MPVDLPPAPPAVIDTIAPQQPSASQQPPSPPKQPPLQIPDSDLFVDVVGELPLQTRIQDMTRLLSRRHVASRQRTYPPIILELIMLVERRPARPPGRTWLAVSGVTLGYDAATKDVMVSYCLDHCEFDARTGAQDPNRREVLYRAPEAEVDKRLAKKLRSLQKYADR